MKARDRYPIAHKIYQAAESRHASINCFARLAICARANDYVYHPRDNNTTLYRANREIFSHPFLLLPRSTAAASNNDDGHCALFSLSRDMPRCVITIIRWWYNLRGRIASRAFIIRGNFLLYYNNIRGNMPPPARPNTFLFSSTPLLFVNRLVPP